MIWTSTNCSAFGQHINISMSANCDSGLAVLFSSSPSKFGLRVSWPKTKNWVWAHSHATSLLMATDWSRSITSYISGSAVTNPPMVAASQTWSGASLSHQQPCCPHDESGPISTCVYLPKSRFTKLLSCQFWHIPVRPGLYLPLPPTQRPEGFCIKCQHHIAKIC